MKTATLPLFMIACGITVSSCCTKVDCSSIDYSSSISFHGFKKGIADSIVVESFEQGSGPVRRLDSFAITTSPSYDDSNLIAYLPVKLNTDLQYKVTLPATGTYYWINGFEVSERNCNKCFPYHPASDKYKTLNAYQINTVRYTGASVTINP